MKQLLFSVISLVCLLASIGAMLFNNAYIMNWASPSPKEVLTTSYSYFDLMPWAYASIFPLLTAVTVIIATLFILISLFSKKRAVMILGLSFTGLGMLTSILAALMCYSFTIPGVSVVVFLIIAFTMQLLSYIKQIKPTTFAYSQ